MNTDKNDNAKDTETVSAKLRNALSPHYGLPSVISKLREHPEILKIVEDMANQAIKNNMIIDSLLKQIDDLYDQTEKETGETFYRKVNVKERLPEKVGIYLTQHGWLHFATPNCWGIIPDDARDEIIKFSGTIHYWLEPTTLSIQSKTGIEFAEWTSENFKRSYPTQEVLPHTEPIWFVSGYKPHFEKKHYTTSELFQLFLKQNPKL